MYRLLAKLTRETNLVYISAPVLVTGFSAVFVESWPSLQPSQLMWAPAITSFYLCELKTDNDHKYTIIKQQH